MGDRILSGGGYLVQDIDSRDVFTPEDFSDEHRQIAATTEQFVAGEIQPVNAEIEAGNFDLVVEKLRACAALGLMMIDAPEEYGGLELDKATSMLVMERMAFARNFGLSYMVQTGIGMLPLIYYGSADQKERYLGRLITAEMIGAYCLTEPGSGSDALGAKTTATLAADGSHYILNGTKQFSSNAGFADLFTIFAKVDKRHFTAFLVERSAAGLSLGPEEKKMGMHGSSTRQVILDNVRVPVANVLGEVGKGHKIAFNVLNVGRFKLGAFCVGQQKYALAEGARYANERRQFDAPISTFGAIREKLAAVAAMTFASEAVVYRLAGLIDERLATIVRGSDNYYVEYQKGIEEYAVECALAKVFCSEAAAWGIDAMLQVHGGYGYIAEYPIEQLYRDERVQRIYEGTNEINRLLIPGLLFRKGIGGKGLVPTFDTAASGEFAAENQLLQGMKRTWLTLADRIVARFGAKVTDEQEILLAVADVAIQIFALESAVLRAEKAVTAATEQRREEYRAVVILCTFAAKQRFINAVDRCAAFLGEEPPAAMAAVSAYRLAGLLAAQRLLAAAVSRAERYIF
ncbi:acyl-CoA dehydrogenase family protein [Desulfoprunum benzoelyticum]|uniref:Alkylation response protein AidB-like acyl-CoA dehydrogenase n=1 Tax=Desulfoprunum benzoelyticum TaxID=1506996 RepID=A0A840V9K9_9BACT|nr:acyl-CoA dehydrogenase family protein [Desulfoprunum benzoelyticum]MBB5349611.1 alkylation response protein AidB-like acyl-CoA dehydrogenase [Desulfoprunum benzoelyticum]MBM9531511.1 acyl-CoA dehydrogenase family protein [Desulfoprunum benzoelyticum]